MSPFDEVTPGLREAMDKLDHLADDRDPASPQADLLHSAHGLIAQAHHLIFNVSQLDKAGE